MKPKQATSIDEVIVILDDIILESENNKDPLGYFAALSNLGATDPVGAVVDIQIEIVVAVSELVEQWETQKQLVCRHIDQMCGDAIAGPEAKRPLRILVDETVLDMGQAVLAREAEV